MNIEWKLFNGKQYVDSAVSDPLAEKLTIYLHEITPSSLE